MPKPTVYLDSTIPSAYFDDRPGRSSQRLVTRLWWEAARTEYDFISSTVLRDEVGRGSRRDRAEARLRLICDVPVVDISPEIRELADWYILHKLMPARPDADAVHLATAAVLKCEYLATWNFGHLANQNKAVHLAVLNRRRGLSVPRICTPDTLMDDDDNCGNR
ncbi:PIN domain-containing protein [Longimicrobium terrae]|uniref:Putative nucleic acid-binding protein n=1 Tax=Longimicrobium terrae TaxID=1639882 RepID=A0A841H3F9_9BACT|nr:PIN domain-containing protein [Longimicrobium terrae]MBB4638391.1 putative nucleic acid-binding protein [Longimicrobium terrae]MBB6072540.1 putative nucleic acid-binding protein [Longimicrobium terrae]NNC28679.1 PIN domain-containing protein [Longimicrobium terrae]